jgi:hypothetical protein
MRSARTYATQAETCLDSARALANAKEGAPSETDLRRASLAVELANGYTRLAELVLRNRPDQEL